MSDETKSESVYERARSRMAVWRGEPTVPPTWQIDTISYVLDALDAGEAAEKRAESAEAKCGELAIQNSRGHQLLKEAQEKVLHMTNTIGAAILLLNPARPEDGLLPAIRDVMQRLALAEAGRSDDDHQGR